MTVIGKILVFFVFIFSVAMAGLTVWTFTTRYNWKAYADNAINEAKKAEEAFKKERAAHEANLKAAGAAVAQLESALKNEQTRTEAETRRANELQSKIDAQTNLATGSDANSKRFESELAQRQEERNQLVKDKEDLQTRLVTLQNTINEERRRATEAEIQERSVRQINQKLLKDLENALVTIRELESRAAGLSTGTGGGERSVLDATPRPAPPGVIGKVTEISKTSDLVVINIGSDSGLQAGHSLMVYRGDSGDAKIAPEYLGQLLLTRVDPKGAVGSFKPATASKKIMKGDSVATSFGGK